MKRNVLFAVAFFATLAASAQNIAAVSPSNVTTMYQTLDEAVSEAVSGSVIYLPGGGFQISDGTKITKKLTIMGVSHRGDADNADGATVIAGNINFINGSSGSSVIGVYVSGNVNIGDTDNKVDNITVRFCNVNSIQVKNGNCSGIIINQSYLRSASSFGNTNVRFENNVSYLIQHISGGDLNHNIMYYGTSYAFYDVSNSSITSNICIGSGGYVSGSRNMVLNNGAPTASGEGDLVLGAGKTWDDVFEKNNGFSIYSDYRLKSSWGRNAGADGTDLGIHGGSGFNEEKSLAPIPRIISKIIDEHTDKSGKLHIEVTVKAD